MRFEILGERKAIFYVFELSNGKDFLSGVDE